jgi:transposase
VRFNRWTKDRTWDRLLGALHAGLDASSKIDWELFAIDGTSVRASRSAARAGGKTGTAAEPPDHALGRSRGGFGTKIHIVCDGRGRPMAVTVTAGQRHESTQFEAVMDCVSVRRPVGRPRRRPRRVAGDKGNSYDRIRRWLRRRGIAAVIPTRKGQRPVRPFDRPTYRRRNIVERLVNWLKERRRLATRFEKLAENFLAMVKLAMMERLLKALLPDRS